jgi:general secretion pathway protein K
MPGQEPGPGLRGWELSAVAARRNARKRERERGVALVVVLFTLVAIALVVSVFSRTTFTGRRIVANEAAHARAHAMLAAGLSRAIVALADPVPGRRWQPDRSVHDFAFAGGTVALSIADEGGKIDLNAAPAAVLKSLLAEFGVAEREATAIVAEIERRRAAARATATKNVTGKAFHNIVELRAIDGISGPLYDALAPFVTVYSGKATVHRDTAPVAVLAAFIGIDRPGLLQAIPGDTTAALNDVMEIMQHLPRASRSLLGDVGPFYTISVEARTDDGAAASAAFVIWHTRSAYSVIERRDRVL